MQKFSNLSVIIFTTFVLTITSCASRDVNESGLSSNNFGAQVEIDKSTNSFKKSSGSSFFGQSQSSQSQKKNNKPFFDWPVAEARMSRGYLPRGTKKRRRPHRGIDLAAQRGSAVLASHDGVVIYTGKDFKGYGKMIMIENGPWATLYAHLDKIVVYEGQKVSQGDVIGALGNTGRSSGPHLHFEIRKVDGPVDPLPYLPAGEALTNDVDNGAEAY